MKNNPSVFLQEVKSLVLSEETVTCNRSTPTHEAVKLMAKNNIGCIVITEDNHPVGIFTERDYLKKVPSLELSAHTAPVEAYMTANPVCISAETQIIKVMSAMRLGKFRHLILTDVNGKLIGVISIKDVLNYLFDSISDSK